MKKRIHYFLLIAVLLVFQSCEDRSTTVSNDDSQINDLLNQWHKDVSQYEFEAYFNAMTDDAVFIGTDATEVWSKQEFMAFSKPYFERKQTWDFKPLERHVYLSDKADLAWFDETLNTWMGICRGSGVVVKHNDKWLIQHYVLSMTIPNEVSSEVVSLKQKQDSVFLSKIH